MKPLHRSAFLQVDEQDFDVGGRDAGDPAGLADRLGPYLFKFLLRLFAQGSERCVVEGVWDFFIFHPLVPINRLVLFLDVSLVFHIHLDHIGDVDRK